MPFRTSNVRLIALSIMIAGTIGPMLMGCTSSQIAQPSKKIEAPPEPVRNMWNPVVASDPNGHLYLTYYGGSGDDRTELYFNRSLDGGTTWLPEPIRVDSTESRGTRFGFHGVETNGRGIISVAWSIERRVDKFWRVQEVRRRQSRDFGATWPGTHLAWRFERPSNYPLPRSGEDGEWYLFWVEKEAGGGNGLFFNRTLVGGDAWSGAPIALRRTGVTQDSDAQRQRRTPPPPLIAWPSLASDGLGRFYLAWQEELTDGDIVAFNRSLDGGRTWLDSAPRLSTHSAHGVISRIPHVALDGAGGVYVVWEDTRDKATDVYFNRSVDHGATWLPEDLRLTVDRPPSAYSFSPVILSDRSGRLYLAWYEHRDVRYSLYFNRSEDRGRTWLPHPIRIDHHGKDATSHGFKLWIDDAGHVYMVWLERGEKEDSIRFNRSRDYGATWLDGDVRLDSDSPGRGEGGSRFPRMSTDGSGRLYVVWSGDRAGGYKLFLNRSTDHGATWLAQEIQITR